MLITFNCVEKCCESVRKAGRRLAGREQTAEHLACVAGLSTDGEVFGQLVFASRLNCVSGMFASRRPMIWASRNR